MNPSASSWLLLVLNPAAKFKSVRDVLCVSALELQNLTGLSPADVQQLLTSAATACRLHPPVQGFFLTYTLTSMSDKCSTGTCLFVFVCEAILLQKGSCSRLESGLRLSVGCPLLDELLRGGLPAGSVIELSGESGAGKTQLALQLCLSVQLPVQHGGLGAGKPPHHHTPALPLSK